MAAFSNYLENKVLDWLLRAQTYTVPTTTYVAIFTATPTAAGGGTEVSGGSYARVAITSSLTNWAGTQGATTTAVSSGTSGLTSNNNSITFPAPTATWGVITGMGIYDASTAGNLLLFSPLAITKTVNNGDAPPNFAISSLTFTIT